MLVLVNETNNVRSNVNARRRRRSNVPRSSNSSARSARSASVRRRTSARLDTRPPRPSARSARRPSVSRPRSVSVRHCYCRSESPSGDSCRPPRPPASLRPRSSVRPVVGTTSTRCPTIPRSPSIPCLLHTSRSSNSINAITSVPPLVRHPTNPTQSICASLTNQPTSIAIETPFAISDAKAAFRELVLRGKKALRLTQQAYQRVNPALVHVPRFSRLDGFHHKEHLYFGTSIESLMTCIIRIDCYLALGMSVE